MHVLLFYCVQNKLQSVSHEETILKLQEKIQTHINDKQRYVRVHIDQYCTCNHAGLILYDFKSLMQIQYLCT